MQPFKVTVSIIKHLLSKLIKSTFNSSLHIKFHSKLTRNWHGYHVTCTFTMKNNFKSSFRSIDLILPKQYSQKLRKAKHTINQWPYVLASISIIQITSNNSIMFLINATISIKKHLAFNFTYLNWFINSKKFTVCSLCIHYLNNNNCSFL